MSLPQEESLLQRYDLQVDQLDYSYVSQCDDVPTLEKIIKVLRSGEEGLYPDLIRYTEERLHTLQPRNRLLQHAVPPMRPDDLHPKHLRELEEDLQEWSASVRCQEEELTRFEVIRAPIPPVRGSTQTGGICIPGVVSADTHTATITSEENMLKLLEAGRRYLKKGDYLQASVTFQKVLASHPTNAGALQGMEEVHRRRDETL